MDTPGTHYFMEQHYLYSRGAPSGHKIVAGTDLLHTPISDETKMVSQIAYSNF